VGFAVLAMSATMLQGCGCVDARYLDQAGDKDGEFVYPLVNVQKAMENHHL
jgi:hypothetical protein